MTDYKRFDDHNWRDFGKNLLKKDCFRDQREFLLACKTKNDFLAYVEKRVQPKGKMDFGIFHDTKLCEREYFRMPDPAKQRHIWERCREMPKDIMASAGFWGYEVVGMIRNDLIPPSYLAYGTPGSNGDSGAVAIDKALKHDRGDDCARRILRSLCNPAPRGYRSLFSDFPLGRVYWRWRWANEASSLDELDISFETALSLLGEDSYNKLAEKRHSGKSYISLPRVFAGLLLYMRNQKNKDGSAVSGAELEAITDRIAFLISWKALEAQLPVENEEEIRVLAESISTA